MPELEQFKALGLALALGLLVGAERGWKVKEAGEGKRVAGIRTFGVIGLLGGASGLVGQEYGDIVLAAAFLAVAMAMMVAYLVAIRETGDYGATTLISSFLTFLLGALAVRGHEALAAAAAVMLTVILGFKAMIHRWLERLERKEIQAALKLLLISVVLLPVLPDEPVDPWGAINPFELWWMVVLIAGLSFIGYFAIKLAGPKLGTALTALLGGLVSSTALTLDFARRGRESPDMHRLLAAGVVLAGSTMVPRILIEVGIVNPVLLPRILLPVGLLALVGYGGAIWMWIRAGRKEQPEEVEVGKPLDLFTALKFGAVLATVMLLARGLKTWLGDPGIYLLSAISGLADVDAITLSLARLSRNGVSETVAAHGILIAASVNTLVKVVLVTTIAGGRMARNVAFLLGAALLAAGLGLVAAGFLPWASP